MNWDWRGDVMTFLGHKTGKLRKLFQERIQSRFFFLFAKLTPYLFPRKLALYAYV